MREENQTLATITLQNYFRLYDKLSGMTGTALTEDAEFREIYKLPVEVIPSNKPVQRVDHEDLVYRTIQAKYNAVADDVERRHAKGQPVLVGTVSIESSEKLSAALTKRGIAHEVLNAKHHEREAHIVAPGWSLWRRDHRYQHGRPRYRRSCWAVTRRAGARAPGVRGPDHGGRNARAA